MQLAHRWADRNLTRLELVVALIVLLLILGAFMRNVLVLFARAEQRMIESTIINLGSSLNYHASMAALRGEYDELSRIEKRSPIGLVQSWQDGFMEIEEQVKFVSETAAYPIFNQATNYLGEFVEVDFDLVEEGDWYFDLTHSTLNYRVINSTFFENKTSENGLVRFRIRLRYSDINSSGFFEGDVDEYRSVSIEAIH